MNRLTSLIIIFFAEAALSIQTSAPPSTNLDAKVEARITTFVQKMTVKEKLAMIRGDDPKIGGLKRLQIPELNVNDGPLGLRLGDQTAFPAGVAMGASFDPSLIGEMAAAAADEARLLDIDVLLGPCVNIHRTPWGGRNFESFGEDPFLTSQMVREYVQGMQNHGVLATVKHFAVNDEEWDRHNADVQVDERTLNEIHLPAFRAAVDAGVWSFMAAYNKVNGVHASESHYLLTDLLKNDWKFSGFVMSDWSGTHSSLPAALAGLDVEMPSGAFFSKLGAAYETGKLPIAVLDDKIRRILRAEMMMGFFDRTAMKSRLPKPLGPESIEHRQLAQRIAEESIVLLKNDGVLPLDRSTASIGVIGPNAAYLRTGGGGSSRVHPFEAISPLDALKAILGHQTKITYATGTEIDNDFWPAIETNYFVGGLKAEYYPADRFDSKPFLTRMEQTIDLDMSKVSVQRDSYSVKWTSKLFAPASGEYKFTTSNAHTSQLFIDGHKVLESLEGDFAPMVEAKIQLRAGQTYDFELRSLHSEDDYNAKFQFGWDIPDANRFEEAVAVAKRSDVAILFVGFGNYLEGEGGDRQQLTLPPDQVQLIDAVTKVNKNVIVVMNSGSTSIVRPWISKVRAVLQAWYPGERGGVALARILTGRVNPSGKLPATAVKEWRDSSAFGRYPGDPISKKVPYSEGIFVGYRYMDYLNLEPEFPFGFGLSYSKFQVSNVHVVNHNSAARQASQELIADVTNIGPYPGAEVVQVYVGEDHPSVPRPPRELKGFARRFLKVGETQSVHILLPVSAFSFWDVGTHGWSVNPGHFHVWTGTSSRDLPFKNSIELNP